MPRACALLACFTILTGCSHACDNTLIAHDMAPDGRHTAVLFNRDCGATTRFSTQISITDAGASPSDKGNAFIADDDHGHALSGPWGGPWASVAWLTPDHLRVRYAKNSRIFLHELRVAGVTVSYEAVDRPTN